MLPLSFSFICLIVSSEIWLEHLALTEGSKRWFPVLPYQRFLGFSRYRHLNPIKEEGQSNFSKSFVGFGWADTSEYHYNKMGFRARDRPGLPLFLSSYMFFFSIIAVECLCRKGFLRWVLLISLLVFSKVVFREMKRLRWYVPSLLVSPLPSSFFVSL